jgi:hypothetical protein
VLAVIVLSGICPWLFEYSSNILLPYVSSSVALTFATGLPALSVNVRV